MNKKIDEDENPVADFLKMFEENEPITHNIHCQDCNGSGVYVGFMQRRGTGVVCKICNGKGYIPIKVDAGRKYRYELFTKRKFRSGVSTVIDEEGYAITYDEFLNGKMPGPCRKEEQ